LNFFQAERNHFEEVINADLECLESDLIKANDKLIQLKALNNMGVFQDFVDELIQEFEVSLFW
jgi:hypothetical protein